MPLQMTFDTAFAELEKLVAEIENDTIQLDTLSAKVKMANELIEYCEEKLRTIEENLITATD